MERVRPGAARPRLEESLCLEAPWEKFSRAQFGKMIYDGCLSIRKLKRPSQRLRPARVVMKFPLLGFRNYWYLAGLQGHASESRDSHRYVQNPGDVMHFDAGEDGYSSRLSDFLNKPR